MPITDLDDRLSFLELAPHAAPGRKPPHWMTLYRWHSRGVVVDGRRIRLRTEKVGGRRYSTRRWLAEFLAAQQDKHAVHTLSPSASSIDLQLEEELRGDARHSRLRPQDIATGEEII